HETTGCTAKSACPACVAKFTLGCKPADFPVGRCFCYPELRSGHSPRRQCSASEFTCSYGEALASFAALGLTLAREFWWEEPEKSSLLSLGIDVDQRHTGLRQLEGATAQCGDHTRKVRLVTDQHQNF